MYVPRYNKSSTGSCNYCSGITLRRHDTTSQGNHNMLFPFVSVHIKKEETLMCIVVADAIKTVRLEKFDEKCTHVAAARKKIKLKIRMRIKTT